MKTLVERLRASKNGKAFMNTRELIAKISYILMMLTYAVFWTLYAYEKVPAFTFYVTFILLPVLTFGLFMRNYYYLYVHNWFFILFNIVTTILFVAIMLQFNIKYNTLFIWELVHLVLANLIGVGVSIAVSFPFKLTQSQLMDVDNLYFSMDTLEDIDKLVNPEKYEKKKQEKKEAMKFDTLNETQLQAELSAALKEERFEDAEKIKKILETKYR